MHRVRLPIFFWLASTVIGCGTGDVTDPNRFSTYATVRFVNVEGGCWQLVAPSGTSYEPRDLPPGFQSDGRQVTVTLRFDDNTGTVCAVGRPVLVLSIRDR